MPGRNGGAPRTPGADWHLDGEGILVNRFWKFAVPAVILVALAAVVVLRLTGKGGGDGRRASAPVVRVQPATRDTIIYRLDLTGDVLPIRQTSIIPKVGGTLDRFYVEMGSAVRDGQLLAAIDSTELREQYLQASATYQNSRATYQRVVQLFAKALSSQQDVDNAEAAMKVALANRELAATRLSYCRIRAPFSGTITRRFVDVGAVLTANVSTMFTLMDMDTVKLIVMVPEKDVPSVYKVRRASVMVDALAGEEFDGRVTRFSEALDLATRTMAIEIRVPNPRQEIKPGMFATVRLTLAQHDNALTIPLDCILRDGNGKYVYIVDGQTARQVRIQTGVEETARAEVLSGLTGTESIIVAGQQYVRNGGPVSIQP